MDALAAKAHEALPLAAYRIPRAVEIVLSGGVTQTEHGWVVQSQSDPTAKYSVNGVCSCADAPTAPHGGFCKHRLAIGFYKRALAAFHPVAEPVEEVPALDPTPAGLDPRFITHLHGRPFVKYAGLLSLAHERGLVRLAVRIEFHSEALVLASATATFSDGRVFTEWADATPANVGAQGKPHWRRLALTRAKARCLGDALNINLCSLEELGEE